MYESKRDNRLRKTLCVRAFFHLFQPPPSQEIPKISWKHPRIQSLNNEKANVYTSRLIIMARSTVEAYSEGYAWARTSENVRGWEGAGIVMESIEQKTRFERLSLNWTHFLVERSLIKPTILFISLFEKFKVFPELSYTFFGLTTNPEDQDNSRWGWSRHAVRTRAVERVYVQMSMTSKNSGRVGPRNVSVSIYWNG